MAVGQMRQESSSDELEQAKDQWDQINVIPIIDLSKENPGSSEILIGDDKVSTIETFEEVQTYYQQLDLTSYMVKICPVQRYSLLRSALNKLPFGRCPSLKSDLREERDRVFATALCPFDNQDPWHYRFLVTIYRSLIQCPTAACPRMGTHWEKIGFQGTDPATDLRGVGMLGIYQLLYLTLSQHREALVRDIYKLSVDPAQEFPFAAMSTNITQMVLQVLRTGKLNRYLNRRGSVSEAINDFYCDLYYQLFRIWKTEKKTIKDAGFVLKEIRLLCKKRINILLRSSDNYESVKQDGERKSNEDFVEFSNIGNVFDLN